MLSLRTTLSRMYVVPAGVKPARMEGSDLPYKRRSGPDLGYPLGPAPIRAGARS